MLGLFGLLFRCPCPHYLFSFSLEAIAWDHFSGSFNDFTRLMKIKFVLGNTRLAVNDILHLRDFQFQIEEFLRSERDSVISLDYDVINTGGDLPLPSPRSPLYDVILSNNDTGIRLIPANMIQYPDDFYRPMLKGSRHTFRGLMVRLYKQIITKNESWFLDVNDVFQQYISDSIKILFQKKSFPEMQLNIEDILPSEKVANAIWGCSLF